MPAVVRNHLPMQAKRVSAGNLQIEVVILGCRKRLVESPGLLDRRATMNQRSRGTAIVSVHERSELVSAG